MLCDRYQVVLLHSKKIPFKFSGASGSVWSGPAKTEKVSMRLEHLSS